MALGQDERPPIILWADDDVAFTERIKEAFNNPAERIRNRVKVVTSEEAVDISRYLGKSENRSRGVVLGIAPNFKERNDIIAQVHEAVAGRFIGFVFGYTAQLTDEVWQWAIDSDIIGVYSKEAANLTGFAFLVNHNIAWRWMRASSTDARTGLPTYEVFRDQCASVLRSARSEIRITPSAQRYPDLFTMLAMDLDHFGPLNVEHGHGIGDKCLEAVARAIQQNIRANRDLCCRNGEAADEFFVLILGDGEQEAKRIRKSVAEIRVTNANGDPVSCSLTIGKGVMRREEINDPKQSFQELFDRADRDLNKKKLSR
jgi:diguanylate cyclase (GGDEF)-like protein